MKLAAAIGKLDKYRLLIIDDLSYVQKSPAETSVLFELISARYERRSILVTANQQFRAWESISPVPAMTIAAIDRLVHHAIILEMNTDSYRRKTAQARAAPPPSILVDAPRQLDDHRARRRASQLTRSAQSSSSGNTH